MAFPEFAEGKRRVLFFSRGRGRGHAVPDVEIAREVERNSECEVRLVSYATGARTIEALGYPVIELDLPEEAPQTDTTIMAGRLIGWLNPNVVVAHEEFAAIPAAQIFGKPVIFITDWFLDPSRQIMSALRFTEEIFFIDEEGVFPEPPYLNGKVRYVGPILREFQYSREDKARARTELGIAAEVLTVAVLPGSWTEAKAPVYDLVMGAFDLLDGPKSLVWVAGRDATLIEERTAGRSDVQVVDFDPQIERIMAAADVAVTKATRKTAMELEALGVPSVSLSHGQSALDETRVARISTNVHRRAGEITAAELAGLIRRQAAVHPPARPELLERRAVAEIVTAIVRAVNPQR